jgi:hypothetical protein
LNSPNNVFSLPFSLTSQTATRRLSITYPCSSDFPFFGFVNPARHPPRREIEATKKPLRHEAERAENGKWRQKKSPAVLAGGVRKVYGTYSGINLINTSSWTS